MNSPLKDPYTITFHRTRDHSLKLRGGARREPTTPSGQRRIWQPPQPDDGQPSDKTQDQLPELLATLTTNVNSFIEQQLATNARFEAFCDSTVQRIAAVVNGSATLLAHDNERRARESILYIAYDELNLVRGRILQTRGWDTAPTFLAAIIAAEENGLITDSQVDNVLVADIIIEARRSDDRQYVHAKQGGKCKRCEETVDLRQSDADHITQWADGGKSVKENCQVLCKSCDKAVS